MRAILTQHPPQAAPAFRSVKALVRQVRGLRARLIDRHLNIDTVSCIGRHADGAAFGDATIYEPVDYVMMRRYMQMLRIGPHEVLVDIGCGMGRTLCLFARLPLIKCIGIEVCPGLAEMARINARRLRGRRAPIEIIEADAAQADYSQCTIFYMFNPFGPATLRPVLERIRQSLEVNPRPIQLIYVNPYHERLLDSCGWLMCTGTLKSRFYSTSASYWRNIQPMAHSRNCGLSLDWELP